MPYSLVNAPALGYDLVRLPHGEQVVRVLRTALACGPTELAALARRHPGSMRVDRWHRLLDTSTRDGMAGSLPLADQALQRALEGDAGSSTMLLRRLERATIGDLSALERLLRSDVLDWTWLRSGDLAVQDPAHALACDVLADAAASAYCAEQLDDDARRALAAPFVAARLAAGPVGPAGTGHPGVDDMLERLRETDRPTRRAWRRAVSMMRPGTASWAPAMHQATWAIHLAGRLRLAADAQLAAASAFREAGFSDRDAAYGVWNALSGAVQGTMAADLLPDADLLRLQAVWERVYPS